MSEVNRPSSSEMAARDAARAADKKVRPQNISKAALQSNPNQTQRQALQKSPFDQVLEQKQGGDDSSLPLPPKMTFDQSLQEVKQNYDDDSGSQDDDSSDEDNKLKDKGDKFSEDVNESKGEVKGRVASKRSLKGQSQGNSEQQQGQGESEGQGKGLMTAPLKGDKTGKSMQQAKGVEAVDAFSKVEAMQRMRAPEFAAKAAQNSPKLTPELMNQLVQQILSNQRKEGNLEIRELEVQLKEFKGLKIKFAQSGKNGPLKLTFVSQDSEIRQLFQYERQNIAMALGEKGVAVSDITVA